MTLEFQVLVFGQAQWYGGAKPVNVKKIISYLAKYYTKCGRVEPVNAKKKNVLPCEIIQGVWAGTKCGGVEPVNSKKKMSYISKCYNVFVRSIYTLTFHYFDKNTPIKDL